MRLKITLAIAGIAALAISSGTATAGNGDKVTGGGQIFVGDNAGSTIAFTAQGTRTDAKGRVTFIDRRAGKGQDQEKFKGIVECVETGAMGDAGFGVVSGHERGDETNTFLLRVLDNGQGANADSDLIEFEENPAEDTCAEGEDEPPAADMELGRGNAKVRDGNEENQPEPTDGDGGGDAVSLALGLL